MIQDFALLAGLGTKHLTIHESRHSTGLDLVTATGLVSPLWTPERKRTLFAKRLCKLGFRWQSSSVIPGARQWQSRSR